MEFNHQKELKPVIYDSSGLKILNFPNYPPGYTMFNLHWHERIELVLVTEGSLHYQLKSHKATLTKDQLAIIPPGQLHYGLAGEEGVSIRTIMFDINTFCINLPIVNQYLTPLIEQKVSFLPWTDNPEIIAFFKTLLDEPIPSDPLLALSKLGKIYKLIELLYRHCYIEDVANSLSSHHFQPVLNYINDHYSEKISSASLSKHFGYSEGYFCRQFKAVTGLTPMIYIRILRLEKAQKMLVKQNCSLWKIAEQCGFTNPNYFTQSFKEHYGITPSEYVQQLKHNMNLK